MVQFLLGTQAVWKDDQLAAAVGWLKFSLGLEPLLIRMQPSRPIGL